LKRPVTVVPCEEIRSTFLASTCSRKKGLYGTRIGSSSPGASSETVA
jgi:aspartate/tyrosine/aromatic aminotransferase